MAPLITNGDRHWCQWRWGAPLASLRPPPLEPMDRHWHHFLSPLAQWREPQIVMTLLPGYLLNQESGALKYHYFVITQFPFK